MRVAVTGARGLIGGALVSALRLGGHAVVRVGRGADSDVRWDPHAGVIDTKALEGIDAMVHLAGAPVGTRWSVERKREIRESRVQGTRLLAETLSRLAGAPAVFVSASAVGYYGDFGDAWVDETSPTGSDFLACTARDWEAASAAAGSAGIRTVHPRIGVVLSSRGGALAKMLPVFRLGLGGRLGPGNQWMSWVTLTDVVRALEFALQTASLRGAVNVVAPGPVTNAEFTAILGRTLNRAASLAVPAVALRMVLGEMADSVLLASQRVRATRLAAEGFLFAYSSLEEAMRDELGVVA